MFGFSMRRDGVKLNYIDLFSMYHSYIQTLLLGSAICFATSQLSGNNGILVIPDVSADGPVGKFGKADKSEEFSNVAQEIAN